MRRVLALFLGLIFLQSAIVWADETTPLAQARTMLEERAWVEQAAWQTLTRSGLPLVQNHPENPDLVRVTFAFRGAGNIRSVRLDSILNAPHAADYVRDYREDFTLPLARIGDSDIWHITIDVQRAVQATYSFLVQTDAGEFRRGDDQIRDNCVVSVPKRCLLAMPSPDRPGGIRSLCVCAARPTFTRSKVFIWAETWRLNYTGLQIQPRLC